MLTGSVLQTTPKRETTLGCENCAMMAASWRNFTLSSSDDPSFRSFSATGMLMTPFFHKPCSTEPNCPDPRCLCTLRINSHNPLDDQIVPCKNPLLNETDWDIFDTAGLYLSIEFILPRAWFKVLLHVAMVYVFLLVLCSSTHVHVRIVKAGCG